MGAWDYRKMKEEAWICMYVCMYNICVCVFSCLRIFKRACHRRSQTLRGKTKWQGSALQYLQRGAAVTGVFVGFLQKY